MLSLLTWTSVASAESGGVVDIASLGGAFPMLYGNIVAILSSGLICVVISLAQNKKYDWKELDQHLSLVTDDMSTDAVAEAEKREQDEVQLKKAFKFSLKGGGLLTLIVSYSGQCLCTSQVMSSTLDSTDYGSESQSHGSQ